MKPLKDLRDVSDILKAEPPLTKGIVSEVSSQNFVQALPGLVSFGMAFPLAFMNTNSGLFLQIFFDGSGDEVSVLVKSSDSALLSDIKGALEGA